MDYCVLSRFGCVQLCDPVNYSPPGSSVHGILQARILEYFQYWNGLLCPPPGYLPNPGIIPASPVAPALQTDSLLLSHQVSHKGILCYAKSLQSCLTLCDPIDGSSPGSPVPGILQARTLEQVAISFSNALKWKVKVKVKSCTTLSDPMDCSLLGSSIHGIFQARVLEWGAITQP